MRPSHTSSACKQSCALSGGRAPSNSDKRHSWGRFAVISLVTSLLLLPMVASLAVKPAAVAAATPVTPVTYAPLRTVYATQATSVSSDWAGYATSGATYNTVSASWTQPSVNCATPSSSYSAYWVGLDGYSTRTVEQIGTDSDCSQGLPTYYAWYEMYPSYPQNLSQPISAGDAISASVTSDGSGVFTLTIADTTRQWSYTTHQTSSSAQLGSAEWITEAPSNGRQTLPLADFGTVTFTRATANGAALGSNPNLDEISLGSRYAGIEAQPSNLSASGTSFSVTTKGSSASGGTGSAAPAPNPPTSPTPPSAPYPGHHHHRGSWGWSQWLGSGGL